VGGGGGQVAKDISQGLSEIRHQVKVITADVLGGVPEDCGNYHQVIRIPTLRKDFSRASFLDMVSYNCNSIIKGLSLIRRWNPDLIHAHFAVPAGFVAWFLSRLTGVDYVITAHLGDVPGGTPEKTGRWFLFVKPFTYPIWNDARRVIAVSQYTRQLALAHYQRSIEVIPNGVNVEWFRPEKIRLHEPPKVIFAGRFVPQKNPLGIIDIMAKIKDDNWKLIMLGDGPLFEKTHQRVRESGLEERVELPGWVTPEEVRKVLLEGDILLMPSFSEGMPIVGVQALASNLAFVVSDIGGFVDIVENGINGYRVSLDDKDFHCQFAEKVSETINNPEKLKTFKVNSRRISEEFDLQKIVKRYEQVFKEIIR
jgi:glycosyltransferase involved in cell wall biosynthesis